MLQKFTEEDIKRLREENRILKLKNKASTKKLDKIFEKLEAVLDEMVFDDTKEPHNYDWDRIEE